MACHPQDDVMDTTTSLRDKTFSIPELTRTDPWWVHGLARLKARSLDRRLAAGEIPASDRLLAAHADRILTPQSRRRLATDWELLLGTARRPIPSRSPRVLVRPRSVLAAEHHVRELIAMIREPGRVNPQGLALAALLLSDGAGPLYNPRRAADLVPALRTAAEALALASIFRDLGRGGE
jgi:hypothetical protein